MGNKPKSFFLLGVRCAGRCRHRPLRKDRGRSVSPVGGDVHIAPSTYDSTPIDAAGHTGPALQGHRRLSRGLVGATPCGRPSTQGAARQNGGGVRAPRPTRSQGVRCAGRCRHRPLRKDRGRSVSPVGGDVHIAPSTYDSTPIDAAGHTGPALQGHRRLSRGLVGATPCGRPSTQGAARQNGGGVRAPRPTRSQGVRCAGRCRHRPLR